MAYVESYSQEIEDNKINERIEAQLLQALNAQGLQEIEKSIHLTNTNNTKKEVESSDSISSATGAIPKRGFSYLSNSTLSAQNNLENSPVLQNVRSVPKTKDSGTKNFVKPTPKNKDFGDLNFSNPGNSEPKQIIIENPNKSILRNKNIAPIGDLENTVNLKQMTKEKIVKTVPLKNRNFTMKSVSSSSNVENINIDTFADNLECNRHLRNVSENVNINRNGSLVRACKVLQLNLEKQKYLHNSAKSLLNSKNSVDSDANFQSDPQNHTVLSSPSKLAQRNAKISNTQLALKSLLKDNTRFPHESLSQRLCSSSQDSKTEKVIHESIERIQDGEIIQNSKSINFKEAVKKGERKSFPDISASIPHTIAQNHRLSLNFTQNIILAKGKANESETSSVSSITSEGNFQDANQNSRQLKTETPIENDIKTPGKLKPEAFNFLSKLPNASNNGAKNGRKSLVPTAFVHSETLHQSSVKEEDRAVYDDTENIPIPSAPPYLNEDYVEPESSDCQSHSKHRYNSQEPPSTSDDQTKKPALPTRPPPPLIATTSSDNQINHLSSSIISLKEKQVNKSNNTSLEKKKVKNKFTGKKISIDSISKPLPPEPNSGELKQSVMELTPPPLPPFPLKLVNKSQTQKRLSNEFSSISNLGNKNNSSIEDIMEADFALKQRDKPLYPSFEAILAVENYDEIKDTKRAYSKSMLESLQETSPAEDNEGYLLDTGKELSHPPERTPPAVLPRKTSQPCISNVKPNESPSGESPKLFPNSDMDTWMSSIERPCLPQKLKTTQRSLSCNSLVQSFREMSFAMWNPPPKEKRISTDSYHIDRPNRSISKESIAKVQTSTLSLGSTDESNSFTENQPQKLTSIPGFSDLKSQLSRYPWYHDVDAREGQHRLRDFIDQNGAFLIRPSSKKTDEIQHTACMVYCGRIINMHIRRKPHGQYALGFEREGEPTFPSICELVKHYQDVPVESSGHSNSVKSFRACFRVTPPKL